SGKNSRPSGRTPRRRNWARVRSQLARSPRVRRLAMPRRIRPVARCTRKRASARDHDMDDGTPADCGSADRPERAGRCDRLAHQRHTQAVLPAIVALHGSNLARIDYDEDEDDGGDGAQPDWRRRLLTWVLAAIGLGLGFLVPYTLYLNHQVGQRFGQLQWQLPTRVYG